jgi:short-subunit dehydrogenase
MKSQRFGRIINMASTAGKHGPAYGAVYGATKAGLIAFTQSLRGELSEHGILSTAICPGFATDGGIYDEIVKATGRRTPPLLGGTTAVSVARAVESAIRTAPPERILNFPALRPMFLFRDVFPRLGERIILAVTRKFLRRAALAKQPSR